MTTEPRTAAGRALLQREDLNSRSFPLITPEMVVAIEREAALRETSGMRAAFEVLAQNQHDDLHNDPGRMDRFQDCLELVCRKALAVLAAAEVLTGAQIEAAIAKASPLVNPRLSEVDWNLVAAALTRPWAEESIPLGAWDPRDRA